jgi:serine/threonine-protein kinase
MPATELRANMDRWQRDWKGRLAEPPPALWIVGDARVVDTAEEATQALASRPPLDRLPPTLDPDAVGRVSLLAGRYEEAESFLTTAARDCLVLDHPFDAVRANLHLGLAREGRGDIDGACAAYHDVLARWGAAKPRSVTADRARDRMRALRCPQ